jgi:hypothetical protein
LLISEHTELFGFMEHGYRLEIVIAIAAEAVAILSLGGFLLAADRVRGPSKPAPGAPRGQDTAGAVRRGARPDRVQRDRVELRSAGHPDA